MTLSETYKLIHVLAAIVWVGGGTLMLVFTWRSLAADREHRLGFARDAEVLSNRVFAPASIVALLFGILMVLEIDAFEFSQAWILIGIIGLAASVVLGMAFFGPQTKRLVSEIEQNDPTAEGRLGLIAKMSILDMTILYVVVWAMVARPGL
ncbi:MAG TPA: DUF2269 family protein [Acidimicrobiia bacterium]|nr:DUF2269 family protein [Acidimicrobiia bacterium]